MYSFSDINKNEVPIIDLLIKHLDLKPDEKFKFGNSYKISAQNAFLISSIVGCNYLINPVGFSLKGRNEVFIHRTVFQEGTFIYSPGLFNRDKSGKIVDGNSAPSLLSKFPNLFAEDKKLICVNLKTKTRSNVELNICNELKKLNRNPEEYIILKLKEDSGFEPILELLSFCYFKKNGYIFENQAPFFQQNFKYKNKVVNGGIPDISLFKIPAQNLLYRKFKIHTDTSIPINFIPFIKNDLFKEEVKESIKPIEKHELILGEAKNSISSKNQAIKQMEKYSFVDLSDNVISFMPDYCNSDEEKFSSLYLDKNDIKFKNKYSSNKNTDFELEDTIFLETSIKMNLLASLNFNELTEIVADNFKEKVKDGFYSFHLIDFCLTKEFEDFLGYL